MRPTVRLLCSLPLVLAACTPGAPEEPAPIQAPSRPLAALVAQQIIVAPVNSLREVDPLGWTQQIPRSREFMRAFDDAFEKELGARGLTQWVYPAALVRAGRGSPAYAVDPYAIAAEPLRAERVDATKRLSDPLASQLRMMIALQETARAVLIPAELHFDKTPDGQGVAVLRVALVDGRTSEIRWMGDVRSAPVATFSRDILTSLVAHTADLIAAR